MKNGYEIVDAHCHIYPQKIAQKAVNGTDNFYRIKSSCTGTVEDLLAQGERAGVDKFVVQSVATTPKQVASINAFIADEVSKFPNKLIGLGTLHQDSEDFLGDVQNIVNLGLKGVKLHPDIQNFKIDEQRYFKMYEACEKYDLPILMHTGDYRYDNSNPNRVKRLLQLFPNITLIGAHFGGWSIYEKASLELHSIPNFYVDCSSAFYYLSREKAREIILRYGVDRVLFGTDYPMWDPEKELEIFFGLGFSEQENKMMLSQNYKTAFKLNK